VSNTNRLEVKAIYRGVVQGARYLGPGDSYLIGATKRAHAPVAAEHIDGDEFPLVQWSGGDFVVNVTGRMAGQLTAGDDLVPLSAWVEDHGTQFPVPAQGHVRVDCGQLSFVMAATEAPELVGRPPVVLKWNEQQYNVYAGLLVLVTTLVVFLIPPDVKALTHDHLGAELRFADFVIAPPESPPPPPGRGGSGANATTDKAGKSHAGPAGNMGDRKSKSSDARTAIAGPRDNPDPHLAKQLRDSEITSMGMLGVLKAAKGDVIASVFGQETALGSDPTSVLGNLMATSTGSAYGVGGIGVVGTGAGGAGEGQGTIGIGAYGLIGGYRNERAAGYGPAAASRLAGRRATAPDFIAGQPVVRGSLDKDIIRRIIRRHVNEVKFCYEQELARHQDLAGRIAVNFTIAPTGQVAAAVVQSTTMANVRVEGCLLGAVRRWEFPRPAGGGLVIATYPFNFVAAGH
jgi:hypothetical protein